MKSFCGVSGLGDMLFANNISPRLYCKITLVEYKYVGEIICQIT